MEFLYNVNWESDNVATECRLCYSIFGYFTNRRHHCRTCGRLVCDSCSNYWIKPDETKSSQRVCKVCITIFAAEQEVKSLLSCEESPVSCEAPPIVLVDVYCLEGQYYSVQINQDTTIRNLSESISTSINIGLFEVQENIYDMKQYKLLSPDLNVNQLLQHWKEAGWLSAKILATVYYSKHFTLNLPLTENGQSKLKDVASLPDAMITSLELNIDRCTVEAITIDTEKNESIIENLWDNNTSVVMSDGLFTRNKEADRSKNDDIEVGIMELVNCDYDDDSSSITSDNGEGYDSDDDEDEGSYHQLAMLGQLNEVGKRPRLRTTSSIYLTRRLSSSDPCSISNSPVASNTKNSTTTMRKRCENTNNINNSAMSSQKVALSSSSVVESVFDR